VAWGACLALALPAAATAREITLEQRVACQTAIEEVYWRHRIWPAENKAPKPSLAEAMSRDVVTRKAEDAVAMSVALDELYHSPIWPEHLQAELDRMARDSRDPKMLAELFAALGSDPTLAAECLARPALAEILSGKRRNSVRQVGSRARE
jgi:hypothetical protein